MAVMKAMKKPMLSVGKKATEVKGNPGQIKGDFTKNDTKGPGVTAPWLKPGAGKKPKVNPMKSPKAPSPAKAVKKPVAKKVPAAPKGKKIGLKKK